MKLISIAFAALLGLLVSGAHGQLNFSQLGRQLQAEASVFCSSPDGDVTDSDNSPASSVLGGAFDASTGVDLDLSNSFCSITANIGNQQTSHISDSSISASGLLQFSALASWDFAEAQGGVDAASRNTLDATFSIASPVPYSLEGSFDGLYKFFNATSASLVLSDASGIIHAVEQPDAGLMEFDFAGTLQPGDYRLVLEVDSDFESDFDASLLNAAGDLSYDFVFTVPEPSSLPTMFFVSCYLLCWFRHSGRSR